MNQIKPWMEEAHQVSPGVKVILNFIQRRQHKIIKKYPEVNDDMHALVKAIQANLHSESGLLAASENKVGLEAETEKLQETLQNLSKEKHVTESIQMVPHKVLPLVRRALYTGEIIEQKEMEYFSLVYADTERELIYPFVNTDFNRFLTLLDHCSGKEDFVNMESL